MKDKIEYYDADAKPGRDLVATVSSAMVPLVGSSISIRQRAWKVVSVTYALDDADDPTMERMRANVTLRACE